MRVAIECGDACLWCGRDTSANVRQWEERIPAEADGPGGSEGPSLHGWMCGDCQDDAAAEMRAAQQ